MLLNLFLVSVVVGGGKCLGFALTFPILKHIFGPPDSGSDNNNKHLTIAHHGTFIR